MPAILPNFKERNPASGNLYTLQWDLLSVLSGGVGLVNQLDMDGWVAGEIYQVKCACLSTDYSLSLRQNEPLVSPNIDEILFVQDINLIYDEIQLKIPFQNR